MKLTRTSNRGKQAIQTEGKGQACAKDMYEIINNTVKC